jgi:hypothetical protein
MSQLKSRDVFCKNHGKNLKIRLLNISVTKCFVSHIVQFDFSLLNLKPGQTWWFCHHAGVLKESQHTTRESTNMLIHLKKYPKPQLLQDIPSEVGIHVGHCVCVVGM